MRKSEIMRLTDAKTQIPYYVVAMEHPARKKHCLQRLGITNSAQILVLNKKKTGDMIVKIRGARIAIDKVYAKEIFVG